MIAAFAGVRVFQVLSVLSKVFMRKLRRTYRFTFTKNVRFTPYERLIRTACFCFYKKARARFAKIAHHNKTSVHGFPTQKVRKKRFTVRISARLLPLKAHRTKHYRTVSLSEKVSSSQKHP